MCGGEEDYREGFVAVVGNSKAVNATKKEFEWECWWTGGERDYSVDGGEGVDGRMLGS